MSISKELLSEVLGINKNLIQMPPIFEASANSIDYLYGSIHEVKNEYDVKRQHKRVNIYELAHKCKEWAIKQGYECRTSSMLNMCEDMRYWAELRDVHGNNNGLFQYADTEPEAIFKACQWILESKQ